MLRLAFAAALALMPFAAHAFERIDDRSEFVSLIQSNDLTRFGIRLAVSEAGGIEGRAFGQRVTGTWNWQDGFFCRTMAYGSTEIPFNCQLVQARGDTLRFTADRGAGDYADLRLD